MYRNPQLNATDTNEVQRLPEEGEIVIATHPEVTGREVDARVVLEISSKKSEGVEIIKSTLGVVESSEDRAKTAVSYIGAPRYRIVLCAENFKAAVTSMNNAVEKIRLGTENHHGPFAYGCEKSRRVYQSGQAR